MICVTCQRVGEPNLAPLLAVLAGATALRKLCMLAYTSPQAFGHCGLLCQLTALEVGPLTGRLDDSHLDDCLWGLTQLQRLRLHFSQGATAVLVLCRNMTTCHKQQSIIGSAGCAVVFNVSIAPFADGRTEDAPSSLPPSLLRLSALTHLSFGMKHSSSQHPGPPRPGFSSPDLPAGLCQQLRSLQFLQLFSCGVVRLPADISLLTGGPGLQKR
jgi:hypothetical protein